MLLTAGTYAAIVQACSVPPIRGSGGGGDDGGGGGGKSRNSSNSSLDGSTKLPLC